MGRTIAEMISDSFKQPVWKVINNPLQVKVGDILKLDVLDYRDRSWVIEEIREYSEDIEGKNNFITDYVLFGKSIDLNGEDDKCIIRLSPKERPENGFTHDVLLLRLSHEHEYDNGLDELLRNDGHEEGGEFQMDDTIYYRIHDARGFCEAEIRSINKDNQDSKRKEELPCRSINYWDWYTEVKDEAGQPYLEFLFIETDCESGWHQFWCGVEIDPSDVTVI